MKKRTALGVATAVALLAGCSSPTVSTQMDLHAQMDSGPAINSSNGRYRAGTADIALTKIVSLPDDQLGFRFVISAPSLRGGCCSFFPRMALVGQRRTPSSDGIYEIDVADGHLGFFQTALGGGTGAVSMMTGSAPQSLRPPVEPVAPSPGSFSWSNRLRRQRSGRTSLYLSRELSTRFFTTRSASRSIALLRLSSQVSTKKPITTATTGIG